MTLGILSMLALSLGTMGQRWIPRDGRPVVVGVGAVHGRSSRRWWLLGLLLEGTSPVRDPAQAAVTLLYLAIVNSIIGLLLLGALVRRGGAGASSSVFFLMPPVTAVLAWLILGETLRPLGLLGLVITVVGVAVATRARGRRVPYDVPEAT